MLKQIYIKNFKAFDRKTIELDKHNIIIGENDSGKSTILEALNIFFNYDNNDKIDKIFIRNLNEPVEIGIWYNDDFYKKTYSPNTFKLSSIEGDEEKISNIKYIYIPVMNYDPKQLIVQLASAKAINNTKKELLEELKEISQKSIDEVINSIDNDLLVINKDRTSILGKETFKYENAIKFNVLSDNVAIESRGTGFQKNLMYALLVGNEYENVILAVDEIENSLSINNCNNLISNIQKNIGQTLFTTHSKEMLKITGDASIIPLYGGKYKTLKDLIVSLDSFDDKTFLLVEGKFDLPWFRKALSILKKKNNYILLPSGGSDDSEHLMKALVEEGKKCLIIKDGDTKDKNCLTYDCVELYVPLEFCNKIFSLNLSEIPSNKIDFFKITTNSQRNEDSVKKILSNHVDEFLTETNPLIKEIEDILK